MSTLLRTLCGELEDMSVFKDTVAIMEVRIRLEPAVSEAEHELATLTAERDKLREDVACMVAKAADAKLDGYRELGARAADAENRLDAIRAERDRMKAVVTAAVAWHVAEEYFRESKALHDTVAAYLAAREKGTAG